MNRNNGKRSVPAVTICGRDGRRLAVATTGPATGDLRVVLDRVLSGKGCLLAYFFGKGLRGVFLQSGELRLKGRLSTHWMNSERHWFVDLQPIDATPSASAISAERAPSPQAGQALPGGDEGAA